MKNGYERIDKFNDNIIEKLEHHEKEILRLIGENPERDGLKDTPKRVAKSMQFLTQGYEMDPEQIFQ